jgi:hypothetical protein
MTNLRRKIEAGDSGRLIVHTTGPATSWCTTHQGASEGRQAEEAIERGRSVELVAPSRGSALGCRDRCAESPGAGSYRSWAVSQLNQRNALPFITLGNGQRQETGTSLSSRGSF